MNTLCPMQPLRHVVYTATAKRMTTQQTQDAEHDALKNPVPFKAACHVRGATGIKAAAWAPNHACRPVKLDGIKQDISHGSVLPALTPGPGVRSAGGARRIALAWLLPVTLGRFCHAIGYRL